MSYFSEKVTMPVGRFILCLIALVAIVMFVLVYVITPTQDPASSASKLFTVFAGLLSGLVVMIGQHLIALKNDRDLDVFRKTRIKAVLLTRDDESFYRNLIKKASNRIDVLGVTAVRFLNDFADESSPKDDKRVLLDALQKKVKVKILVAKKDFLDTDKDKRNFDTAQTKMRELRRQYPDSFEARYYDHLPAHSIVVVDTDCLLGPVFPGIDSKSTPAVCSEGAGGFAGPYLRYFEAEWQKATENA